MLQIKRLFRKYGESPYVKIWNEKYFWKLSGQYTIRGLQNENNCSRSSKSYSDSSSVNSKKAFDEEMKKNIFKKKKIW